MKRFLLLLALVGFWAAALPGFGAGLIIVEDTSWWPGPGPFPPHPIPPPWPPRPIPTPRPFAPLDISSVTIHTRITDQVAVTVIDQEFFNPNAARLEGTFVFPVPKGAHLDKFTMEIDGRKAEAELLSAEKARRIYEDIVRKLRDPGLLEYAGQDMFKVRIFPIEPNSRKRITLSYTQVLKADDGLVQYVLPLGTEKYSARPIKNVSVKVDLETRQPLKSIYSPSHDVEVKRDGPSRATAGYEAKDVQPDTDFALYFSPQKDELGFNLLTYKPAGEDGYFLLLAAPGIDVKERAVVPKDVAFVLDTSGSMAGKKLEQAKKALRFCIENLNAGDRFEIIRFSTEVEPLFEKLVDASAGNREKADQFVKDLRPIGGTAIDDALKRAAALRGEGDRGRERPFVVIFLTDGQPTVGVTDEDQILASVRKEMGGQTRVFCFGIGTDVNTRLLDKITEETRAFSQYVLPEEDLELKLSSFYSKIKEPVLANPVLRITGDARATKLYPSPLPDLFKGEQLVLAGRYTGQGDVSVVIEGRVNGAARSFKYPAHLPERATDNEFIPRLWAARRVGALLDEIRLHGENNELRDEVTDLARKYGIVTPYTAYLILEDEARRGVAVRSRSLQDFDRDPAARREASMAWGAFKSESVGPAAVANARYGLALRAADSVSAAGVGGAMENQRALGLPMSPTSVVNTPAEKDKQRLVQYAQQTRFVAGKNFFQNQAQWIDADVQNHASAKKVRIQFNSPEYFQLVATNAAARPWLALGQDVQFVLNHTVYDVYR